MGVLSDNRAQITAGGLISASFVSDLYNVLTGNTVENLSLSGSVNITGSLIGTLTGTATTASYVLNAVSASYSISSSVASTSSFAVTASYSTTAVTSSFVSSTLTFKTGSLSAVINGALAVSSSGDLYFGSGSVWHKVSLV
jgi:hypothetical protein